MKNLIKFIVLALVAFALGATLAWFQGRQGAHTPVGEDMAMEQPLDIRPAIVGQRTPPESTIDGAPSMPNMTEAPEGWNTSEMAAVSEEAAAEAVSETAAEAAAAPEGQKVAGSSVGGSFTMVDHNGADVTEKSWPGKKKLVFFGFTHCPDICPAALDKMGAALTALGDHAAKLQPIFVTTDPARDTPERLKEYLADYDSRLTGLTGSDEQVEHIKSIYKVYAAKAEGGDANNYLMDHSGYVYLMSENDELLEIFGSDSTAEVIVQKSTPHLK